MKMIIYVIFTVCLTACMTVPVSPETATPVEQEFVYGGQLTSTADKPVKVVVVRDSGGTFLGLAPGIMVYCDGTRLANIRRPAEKYTFYVAPGLHTINVVYVAPPPSNEERPNGTSGVNITAVKGHVIILDTGVSPGADEPMRIYQVPENFPE